MTVKDFIGKCSIDEITKRIVNSLDARDVSVGDCHFIGNAKSTEDLLMLFNIWIESDICQKCKFHHVEFDGCEVQYEWCIHPNGNKGCAYEKEWDNEIYNKIKNELEKKLNKELGD